MFLRSSDDGFKEALEGIRLKTLSHGEQTMMVEFRLKQGASLPRHEHPHEQTGYLVSGKLQLTIDGKTRVAEQGDSWSIPGNTPHEARALAYTVAIEVFSPPREDYLPRD